jgi:carbon-monoxide dehydrogenase large subunit
MDRIAHELGIDPVEVRRRNFIAPDAFPHRTVMGLQYESGNYQAGLDRLVEIAEYDQWRAKQRERRTKGDSRLLGLGLSTFIESAGGAMSAPGMPQEAATVRIRRDGTILVQSGVAHNGQGHFTAFAQIAAEVFHVPGSQVEVQMNDAALPAFSIGTFGSRVTQTGGSAVLLAAEAARDKALHVAAHVLEAAPADLELGGGRVQVRGAPARAVTLGELARLVEEQPDLIEHEPPNPANRQPIEGLAAWRDFSPPDATYSSGAHLAVVEIDADTGEVHLLRYIAVDDCGRVLNHYLVEAQIHGSLAQGIGQALYEEVTYDEYGQLLTGTLMDYTLPKAAQMPTFTTALLETPSPRNPLGAKGVGEGGTIAAPPAVVNAVLDALAPLGIKAIDMPLKPEKIWQLIQAARAGTLEQPDPIAPAIFDTASQAPQGDTPNFE